MQLISKSMTFYLYFKEILMLKKLSIVILFFLFSHSSLYAMEKRMEPNFNLSVKEWISSGDASWNISDSGFNSNIGKQIGVKSKLEFKDIDAPVTILEGEIAFPSPFKLKASYGFGSYGSKGRTIDTDWFSVPADGINDRRFSESISKADGETSLFELGGSVLISQSRRMGDVYFYAGYMYYTDDIEITEGRQTFSDNSACTPLDFLVTPCFDDAGTPILGLNSTYDFRWEYIKVGIEGEKNKGRFPIVYGLKGLYLLDYRGEGFWNLRGDLKRTPPNFVHNADEGYGYDAHFAIGYHFNPRMKVFIGYRIFYMKATDGTNEIFFSDGTRGVALLDDVEVKRRGGYLAFDMRF